MVRLPDPLALSTGVVPRLILAIGLSGLLWNALTPLGLLGAGAALLGAAVTTARRAAISGLLSA